MYDAGKIIAGIVVFLILLTLPLWYVAATGEGSYVPEPATPAEEEQCVEPVEYMTKKHMTLLNHWKGRVVRDGVRTYVASDGQEYEIGLTATCLGCHEDKAEFCDQCHQYAGIDPFCWDCHVGGEQ